MAAIGSLEGSEEGGVASVLEPGVMIDEVHRVRGGALFELGFIAPGLVDSSVDPAVLARAQSAISRLGTAFQIVDDLTDFEVDLERGTHNILAAQITHAGTAEERARLAELRKTRAFSGDVVAEDFAVSGRLVVEIGEREAHESLVELQKIGFWLAAVPQRVAGQGDRRPRRHREDEGALVGCTSGAGLQTRPKTAPGTVWNP